MMSTKTISSKLYHLISNILTSASATGAKKPKKAAIGKGAKCLKSLGSTAWDQAVEYLDVETCSAHHINHPRA